MDIVFDRNWFKREQNRLLWLLNHSTYFRKDLGIQECDLPHNVPITEITPNSFSWGDRYFERDGEWFLERTTYFGVMDRFARRMYYAFYPVWNIAHKFDLSLANRFAPTLNLGFDTLTVYPAAGANSPCDGYVEYMTSQYSGTTFSSIVGQASGTDATATALNIYPKIVSASSPNNSWRGIDRGAVSFNTSSLTSSATISNAVLSLYGTAGTDSLSCSPNMDIYSFSPAANDNLVVGDYDAFGTTSYTGSPISYANWKNGSYNDFALNSTGKSAISKIGITNFGVRNANYDVANSAPAWTADRESYCGGFRAVDYLSGSLTPKLVVTYSVASAHFLTSLGVGK